MKQRDHAPPGYTRFVEGDPRRRRASDYKNDGHTASSRRLTFARIARIETMPVRTGARLLVDQLQIQGVNHVFCVPGESYLAVLDALADAPIKLVVNRHESGSTFMADAYAKLTGQPGVAFVTRGPGATNASIGIHTAFQDSTPVIMFIGQVGNEFVEREAFQEIDYRRMFGPMTKWVAQIDSAARVPEYVARAFQIATSGRQGPVVLALPEDMLSASADVPDAMCHQPVQAGPSDLQIATFRRALGQATRPLVILGGTGWTQAACDNASPKRTCCPWLARSAIRISSTTAIRTTSAMSASASTRGWRNA
jgi:thiamine pyrophosphate-dependent acetolactate synthase large subunit-like protein